MADNAILVNGFPVASDDRAGTQYQRILDAPAQTATVIVAAITTSSVSPAIASDLTTRRQVLILNTGSVTVEISPVASFAFGAGFPLVSGGSFGTNYSGAIYARTFSGTSELRAWSED